MNVDEDAILEACGQLTDFHAWPSDKIDPNGWLSNFGAADRPFALYLLSRFMFFADHLVDQLLFSAFQNISSTLIGSWSNEHNRREVWEKFCSDAIITFVQGERPRPTDSGFLFTRKARQYLGLSEHAIMEPEAALSALRQRHDRPVVFLDDFIGSGDQFFSTWDRKYPSAIGDISFRVLEEFGFGSGFFLCTSMGTEAGRDRIVEDAPSVNVCAGNLVPRSFSLVSPDSSIWPEGYKAEGIDFISRASKRIGCVSDGGAADWRGYGYLGLGLAFAHSTPDATLPLFRSEANGWKPLVRRS